LTAIEKPSSEKKRRHGFLLEKLQPSAIFEAAYLKYTVV
jgi:hypothetical protein